MSTLDDNHFILICLWSDATLDIKTVFRELNEYDDDSPIDEPSLLAWIKPDWGLEIMQLCQFQEKVTLFELPLLNEAGLIDNDTSSTGVPSLWWGLPVFSYTKRFIVVEDVCHTANGKHVQIPQMLSESF